MVVVVAVVILRCGWREVLEEGVAVEEGGSNWGLGIWRFLLFSFSIFLLGLCNYMYLEGVY